MPIRAQNTNKLNYVQYNATRKSLHFEEESLCNKKKTMDIEKSTTRLVHLSLHTYTRTHTHTCAHTLTHTYIFAHSHMHSPLSQPRRVDVRARDCQESQEERPAKSERPS